MEIHTAKNNIFSSPSFALLTCFCLLFFTGCNPRESALQQEHTNSYLSDEELEGYEEWVKNKETHSEAYEALMIRVDEKTDFLKEHLAAMRNEQQTQAREDIRYLEEQKAVLKNRLNQLNQAGEQNWREAQNAVKQVADSLDSYMEELDKNVEFGGS
jgi:folate-binding Fe-S cluster repair protein YgfZ